MPSRHQNTLGEMAGFAISLYDSGAAYFLNNALCMRYRWFRSRGLLVGSGVVEASCKTIVGQRLKQAGTHWTVAGADAIITMRCKEASSCRSVDSHESRVKERFTEHCHRRHSYFVPRGCDETEGAVT